MTRDEELEVRAELKAYVWLLIGAWFAMLLSGWASHTIWPDYEPMSYFEAVFTLALVQIAFAVVKLAWRTK